MLLYGLSTINNAYSAWFLTEDGLYEVLMHSRKPIAKRFKKQVTGILKDIPKADVLTKHIGSKSRNVVQLYE